MSFADLKKQSSLGSLTAKLVKEVEKANTSGGGGDERLWKPELDKKQVMDMQLSVSFLHLRTKSSKGKNVHSCLSRGFWWLVY